MHLMYFIVQKHTNVTKKEKKTVFWVKKSRAGRDLISLSGLGTHLVCYIPAHLADLVGKHS